MRLSIWDDTIDIDQEDIISLFIKSYDQSYSMLDSNWHESYFRL